jgi:aspartyl-tRNA(Asn)/glutamyl-tRNA(Gln) amidotransferase subunit A
VPLRGVVALATSLDHVGPMARSAEDAAILLAAMAGHDPADPTSADVPVPDYRADLGRPVRGLRAGVLRGPLWEGLPSGIAAALHAALGELGRLGMVLEDVELPEWESAATAVSVLIRCEAAAEYRSVLAERPADLLPEVRERLETGAATSAPDYVDARRAAGRFTVALRGLLGRVDLLVLPGRDQTAPRMEASGRLLDPVSGRNYFAPVNPAGVPALVVPCGFERRDGCELPIGLQVVGRAWDEGLLLRVAHAFQHATDWHQRRPPLDS